MSWDWMSHLDRRVLDAIINKFGGGPVGLDTMAASISAPEGDLTNSWMWLSPTSLQLGFADRTPHGRSGDPSGLRALKSPYTERPRAGRPLRRCH